MSSSKEWIIYEENKPKVLSDLKDGRMDYLDLSSWDFLDRFFAFLLASRFFEWCASSYPSPRRKEEVPSWFLLSCAIQMKLHLQRAFHALPGILRSGAILSRVGFNVGLKEGGFNHKNKKKRETAVHQDTVRKYFKDTEPARLLNWFNHPVVGWFRRHRGFEKEGIFLLDLTLIPLPPGSHYEKVAFLPLDEEGNYIDVQKLSKEERKKVKLRPCYALTSLLHLSLDKDYFFYAGAHLGPGKESGLKEGQKLVEDFLTHFGKGVIKLLIMDRGFIDGPLITRLKKRYAIDVLIPLKRNMEAFVDAWGLCSLPETSWEPYSLKRDEQGKVILREEVTAFSEITSWGNCEVPLYVALMKRTDYVTGEEEIWALACTKSFKRPAEAFDLYRLRTQIEERHRQLKGCWLLGTFNSTTFSLVVTHVVFVLLVYSLLQLYLKRKQLQHLAHKTIVSLRQEEALGKNAAIVYSRGYFAVFDLDEYTDIIVNLEEEARKRLSRWIKEFKRQRKRSPPFSNT